MVTVATPEALRRFWVLCDPADGVDAGVGQCPTGGFVGLDVDDDASLARFAANCGRGSEPIAASATSVTLGALPEGRPYRFAVVAEDLAGNRSLASRAVSCGSAQRVTDFWERYRSAGGSAEAGCAMSPRRVSAGGWGLAVLAVLAARLSGGGVRGRRR
jgi:hypothetical protein